jgi:uncharacterized lipoprotein
MKKASVLFAVVALGACVGGLFGQEIRKPGYPFKLGKKFATAMFAEKNFDEVWVATIRALVVLDYTLTVTEKDAGIISAGKGATSKTKGMMLGTGFFVGKQKPIKKNLMTVMIETQGDKVAVSMKLQKNKICAAFFDKVAELLYGKTEKK